MAEPKAMDLKNCSIFLRDGTTPTPFELEIKMDEGNLTWEVTRNLEPKKNRGILDYIKEGDQEPMKLTLEGRFALIKASTGDPVSPFEFMTKTGGASAYKTTGAACSADCVDIVVKVNQPCTTIEDEIITFTQFHYESLGGDFSAGTLSMSGFCNSLRPTGVRTTLP